MIVAIANFRLTASLEMPENRMSAVEEEQAAAKIRDMAIQELEAEIISGATEVKEVATDIGQMVKTPLGTVLPGIIGPLAKHC